MSVKEGWIEVGSSFVSFFYRSKGSDSSRWCVVGGLWWSYLYARIMRCCRGCMKTRWSRCKGDSVRRMANPRNDCRENDDSCLDGNFGGNGSDFQKSSDYATLHSLLHYTPVPALPTHYPIPPAPPSPYRRAPPTRSLHSICIA